ncbi:MAG: helix-turn-helix transcriptional regulator [Dysosmobacter sp.]|nr:helix-turn-helix transcriptional regulator [Dysosmobacter sp.]
MVDRSLLAGSTGMLLLKLLEGEDLYGYEMIEELRRRSDHTFDLKAGTLYPLLHGLEEKGLVTSWVEESQGGRPRKYYHLTDAGRDALAEKETEWRTFSGAVDRVLRGGTCLA